MAGSEPAAFGSIPDPATIIFLKGGLSQTESGISTVLGGLDTITAIVGDVFSMITGNPVLLVFCAAGLLSIGISVFRRLKRAAR